MEWIFILFLLYTLIPVWRQQRIHIARYKTIRKLESNRGSRVITLIHRQESLSFLGIPFRSFINIEDSEQILRAIRLTPDNMPIDLILHTPGGLVLASEQIAVALQKHPAKVTVFVPHYAMSGGTMICLAADEIILDENAVLGPVDPQLGRFPAASILEVIKIKELEHISDETLIMADIARKAIQQVKTFIKQLLLPKMDEQRAEQLSEILADGRWTHDYPITGEWLKEFGLSVRFGLPKEVYLLMELYPQSPSRRPTVQYIPIPYRVENNDK
jgi:ClpP class serine protease